MAADRSHFFWWGGEPELIRVARGENLMLPRVLPQPMGYMFDHLNESPCLQRLALVPKAGRLPWVSRF